MPWDVMSAAFEGPTGCIEISDDDGVSLCMEDCTIWYMACPQKISVQQLYNPSLNPKPCILDRIMHHLRVLNSMALDPRKLQKLICLLMDPQKPQKSICLAKPQKLICLVMEPRKPQKLICLVMEPRKPQKPPILLLPLNQVATRSQRTLPTSMS